MESPALRATPLPQDDKAELARLSVVPFPVRIKVKTLVKGDEQSLP